jgi:glyoxylase-like metal-dependent hydrolase (beta-lactamase superfamily II)
LVDFTGPPIGPFAGSFDVARDGTLMLVPTPGHTRGHMAMLVRSDLRDYLCCGDLAKSSAELAKTCPAIDEFCRKEALVVLATHDRTAADLLRPEGQTTPSSTAD